MAYHIGDTSSEPPSINDRRASGASLHVIPPTFQEFSNLFANVDTQHAWQHIHRYLLNYEVQLSELERQRVATATQQDQTQEAYADIQAQLREAQDQLQAAQQETITRNGQLLGKNTEVLNLQARVNELQNDLQEQWNNPPPEPRGRPADRRPDPPPPEPQPQRERRRRSSSSAPKSEKLPDPEQYKGDGKEKFKAWKVAMAIKLSANNDRYPTDHEKLSYAYGRLAEKARDIILPHCSVNDDGTVTFDIANFGDMCKLLNSAFGDQNEEATALEKIKNLNQGGREFSHYRADFNRYNAVVKYTGLALLEEFRRGISQELKDAWSTWWDASIMTYDQLCDRMEVVDHQIRRARKEANAGSGAIRSIWQTQKNSNNTSTTQSNRQTTSSTPASTAAAQPTRPSTAPLTTTTTTAQRTTTQGGDTMDLSSVRRGPLSAEEREARRVAGNCIFCNQPGHFKRDCPSIKNKEARAANISLVNSANDDTASVAESTAGGVPVSEN